MFVSLFVNIYCEDKINMMKENSKSFKMLTFFWYGVRVTSIPIYFRNNNKW